MTQEETKKTMRAVVLTGHGDLEKLEYHENWPKPTAAAGEALIRVGACGLNNTDINTRTGWYSKSVSRATTGGETNADDKDAAWGGKPLQFPRIQGADVCGVVEEIGDGADAALLGKRVLIDTWLRDWRTPHDMNKCGYFGSECDGGFAEYVSIDARHVHPLDSALTDAELATFATSYSTAEGMLNRAAVKEGDIVLISGASGGVGSALIQLCRRRGARVAAMCGEEKAEAVRAIGAELVLPRVSTNIGAALQKAFGRGEADVVADVVGGEEWARWMGCIARGGRYVTSGAIAGPLVPLDLRTLYLRDLSFYGSTVLPPGVFADLVGYIERGEVRPLLAAAYPLEQLRQAQQAFLEKRHVGNIVVYP